MSSGILESMSLIAHLAEVRGESANKKVCYLRVDEQWEVAVNGCDTPQEFTAPGGWKSNIKPFHTHLYFNGWLAGVMSPFDGAMASGTEANERSLCEALKRAITVRLPVTR